MSRDAASLLRWTDDHQLTAIRDVLARVTFQPPGCPVIPITVDRRADGRIFLFHDLPVADSRQTPGVWFHGVRFGDKWRGEAFDVDSIKREIALHVATAGAHEHLEHLRFDGHHLHDPHVDGEPVVVFATPRVT